MRLWVLGRRILPCEVIFAAGFKAEASGSASYGSRLYNFGRTPARSKLLKPPGRDRNLKAQAKRAEQIQQSGCPEQAFCLGHKEKAAFIG